MAADAPRVAPGDLLVSSTELVEPTFRRTVVYLVEHSGTGSLGVVLNRPSEAPVSDVVPAWGGKAADPATIFVGGPVRRDAALCLGVLRDFAPLRVGLRPVEGRVVLVDLDAEPDELVPRLRGIRLFAGYSGWSAGQLDTELDRQDWIVVPSLPDDVLTPPGVDLWARVLRRQPMPLALLATHPLELDRN
ncbi:YqgE/AlgH family protein [Rhodococcus aerolatus]